MIPQAILLIVVAIFGFVMFVHGCVDDDAPSVLVGGFIVVFLLFHFATGGFG